MHFQRKCPQAKLIRVTKGKIFDVVVDLRRDSKTFCEWDSIILDDKMQNQFWAPKGLAHGFLSLSNSVEVEYMCTDIYNKDDEECLIWNDPQLNITWPTEKVILSKKDSQGKTLKEILNGK